MMDKSVIEKVIKYDGGNCPTFKYGNPLLDKNVADRFSKGLIKLLSNQHGGNDRAFILKNIRKSCKVEPSKHLHIDDNTTELLRNAYEEYSNNNINKDLDSFLIRNLKELNIKSVHSTHLQPDIIQALTNLNRKPQKMYDILLKDIIYWNIDDSNQNSYIDILKTIWTTDNVSKIQYDDISIKIKPMIEEQILRCAYEILYTTVIDYEEWLYENNDLMRLIEICSISSECFQICCSIINSLFINTNFDTELCTLITFFINSVKFKASHISQLYPTNLQHVVLLVDIKLENFEAPLREVYIENTLKHLHDLHNDCENNVIMLLSHFHEWFEIYYNSHARGNVK